MSLPNDLLELFTSEYDKLENLVNALNFDSELPVNEIVEVYYQITSLSSLITVVKSQLDKNNDAVSRAEKLISEKFNSAIHPKIMEHIAIGAERGGKNPADVEVVCRHMMAVTEDKSAARNAFRALLYKWRF